MEGISEVVGKMVLGMAWEWAADTCMAAVVLEGHIRSMFDRAGHIRIPDPHIPLNQLVEFAAEKLRNL